MGAALGTAEVDVDGDGVRLGALGRREQRRGVVRGKVRHERRIARPRLQQSADAIGSGDVGRVDELGCVHHRSVAQLRAVSAAEQAKRKLGCGHHRRQHELVRRQRPAWWRE